MAGDISTLAAMGAHALPITTSVLLRDTAEIFDHHAIAADGAGITRWSRFNHW